MLTTTYKNKKVLITGNTGFKGSWLSLWLLTLGAEVFGIAKDIPTNPALFEVLKLNKKITHFRADLNLPHSSKKIIAQIKPDFIFHLAAQAIVSKSYQEPIDTIMSNVVATANVLEAAKCLPNPCVVVIVTTDKCYANTGLDIAYQETDKLGGADIYSSSKAAADLIANSYHQAFFAEAESKVKMAIARAGNVIGGGDWAPDRIVSDCYRAWSRREKVGLRNLQAIRPWQHVLDPLYGYLLLGCNLANGKFAGEQFNFGPQLNTQYTVEQLVADLSLAWGFSAVTDAYYLAQTKLCSEANILRLNSTKAFNCLQWCCQISYKKMLEFTNSWYKAFYLHDSDVLGLSLEQINFISPILL